MMGFVHVAVVVVCLLSAGQSAPVMDCDTLTQQIDIPSREQLLGKWFYIAESTTIPESKLLTKMFVETSQITVSAAEESNAVLLRQTQKTFGRCMTLGVKAILENNTLSGSFPFYQFTDTLVRTSCPDCKVYIANMKLGRNNYKGLQLLSRRRVVTPAELEEFRKQVECLNLPPPAILASEEGHCPDVSQDTETEMPGLSQALNDTTTGSILDVLDKVLNTEGGLQQLLTSVSSALLTDKRN